MSAPSSKLLPGGALDISQGAFVSHRDQPCRIRRILSSESVLVQYLDSGETERAFPWDLRPISPEMAVAAPSAQSAAPNSETPERPAKARADIEEITDEEWLEAQRLYGIIEPLLSKPCRSRADVEAVAKTNDVATSTVYGWLRSYQDSGHISGLVKQARGRKRGTRLLSPEQEAIIDEVIDSKFLNSQSDTPASVIEEIELTCRSLGIRPPHKNTIRNRIADLPLKRQLRARGNKDLANQNFEPRPGEFPDASYPLECIQIDHVQLNIKCVDAETRQPIETRPWLTLAIDVFTRMIAGYFLSFARPSAFAAGVCLYMAMMPKRDLLARLDLPGRWPVYGKFGKVHSDNAKEFKGEVLRRACDDHHIDLQLRPVKTPHYGAHIERMVGNVNLELHKKLGTTHRSPKISPDYDSSANAVYTLPEIEVEFVDWAVNKYHVSFHSGINTTPLRRWEQGLMGDAKRAGIGLPPMPADPEKLRLDFLPLELRAIHPYGVQIANRYYYHETLNRWIGARDPDDPQRKRKFIFRYDPRSIRRVWFKDPELGEYFEIPLADTRWPDMSWSEFDEYRKAMIRQGMEHVDEEAILGYALRSKAREAQAIEATHSVRRAKKKRPAAAEGTKNPANTAPGSEVYAAVPTGPERAVDADRDDDLFDGPAAPFEDIDL